MGDSYVEVLVEREKNTTYAVLKIVMYVCAALCIFLALGGALLLFLVGVALGAIGVFVIPSADYEYEYLLINKDFSVDRIDGKTKRKTVASYDLNNMEMLCPYTSHELDSYKNKKTPIKDFSSSDDTVTPYVIVYHGDKGDELVAIEPDEELIKAIRTMFPRKVVQY